jgi:hypothetical protein
VFATIITSPRLRKALHQEASEKRNGAESKTPVLMAEFVIYSKTEGRSISSQSESKRARRSTGMNIET